MTQIPAGWYPEAAGAAPCDSACQNTSVDDGACDEGKVRKADAFLRLELVLCRQANLVDVGHQLDNERRRLTTELGPQQTDPELLPLRSGPERVERVVGPLGAGEERRVGAPSARPVAVGAAE